MTDVKTTPKVTATADVIKAPATKTVDLDKAAEAPVPEDAGKGSEVSAEDQKLIDAALGDHSEGDDDDDAPKPATTKADAESKAKAALKNFRAALKGVPSTTPDEHPLWGNASGSIRVGDLRALLSALPELD